MFNRRSTRIILSLIAILCFLLIGRNYFGQLGRIAEASWIGVAGIVIVHLLTLWLQSLTYKFGLDSFKQKISATECFVLFVLGSYANLILPKSGIGTTAVYLNQARKTSLINFTSVVLFNTILFVMSCCAIGSLILAGDWLMTGSQPVWWMGFGIPLLFVISVVAVSIKWKVPDWSWLPGKAFLEKVRAANASLASLRILIGTVHLALALMRALRLYIAFWALGVEVGFVPVLLTSILGDIAFVFAITPGAIGFREAAIAISAAKLGIPVEMAISVAIFDRLVFSSTVVVAAQVLLAFVIGKRHPSDELQTSHSTSGAVSQ